MISIVIKDINVLKQHIRISLMKHSCIILCICVWVCMHTCVFTHNYYKVKHMYYKTWSTLVWKLTQYFFYQFWTWTKQSFKVQSIPFQLHIQVRILARKWLKWQQFCVVSQLVCPVNTTLLTKIDHNHFLPLTATLFSDDMQPMQLMRHHYINEEKNSHRR
jgi:hypothetical protein